MDKNIRFDHTYTNDQSHKFLKKLMDLGFTKVARDVEHPGKHFCSFIEFLTPNRDRAYLEFINVGRGGVPVNHTGLSFRYEKNLKQYYTKLKDKVPFKTFYMHKNYDWKKNSVDYLPGWNFLDFKGTGFRSLQPWFTEYENRKKLKKMTTHKNKVSMLTGGTYVLNSKGRDFFELILRTKVKDKFEYADGTCWEIRNGATNKIDKINLECSNLKLFPNKLLTTDGFALVKNPNGKKYWDICIYES